MAGVQYTVTLNDIGLASRFDAVAAGAEDMTELMDMIGSALINGARTRIAETNVDPDGVPWPKSFRVLSGQGGKTLYDQGNLLASITEEPEPREVTVGSALIYAGVHQAGGTINVPGRSAKIYRRRDEAGLGRRFVRKSEANEVTDVTIADYSIEMPARPYLGISEGERETILDLTTGYFDDLLTGEVH